MHTGAHIHAGYCSRINEINAWARLNTGCHICLNGNMVLCIKKNECIVDISLNKCIFLSEDVTVDHLHNIRDVRSLPALMRLATLSSVNGVHIHVYKRVGL